MKGLPEKTASGAIKSHLSQLSLVRNLIFYLVVIEKCNHSSHFTIRYGNIAWNGHDFSLWNVHALL